MSPFAAELEALRAELARLRAKNEQLERVLRPFADVVCSLRWLCADNGEDLQAHEEALYEKGPGEDWSDLVDAHDALNPKCNQVACARIAKLREH